MCFNFIYVLLCFVLCFYIWFWIAFRIIEGGKTASPSSEAWFNRWILGWLEMSLFCMHLVLLSASCYIWSLLDFYYFVFWYFFSISFWFILMFFHLIILNIFLFFYCYWVAVGDFKQLSREALATWIAVCDCQLSTSILHVCLNVIAMILCSAWHNCYVYICIVGLRAL